MSGVSEPAHSSSVNILVVTHLPSDRLTAQIVELQEVGLCTRLSCHPSLRHTDLSLTFH